MVMVTVGFGGDGWPCLEWYDSPIASASSARRNTPPPADFSGEATMHHSFRSCPLASGSGRTTRSLWPELLGTVGDGERAATRRRASLTRTVICRGLCPFGRAGTAEGASRGCSWDLDVHMIASLIRKAVTLPWCSCGSQMPCCPTPTTSSLRTSPSDRGPRRSPGRSAERIGVGIPPYGVRIGQPAATETTAASRPCIRPGGPGPGTTRSGRERTGAQRRPPRRRG